RTFLRDVEGTQFARTHELHRFAIRLVIGIDELAVMLRLELAVKLTSQGHPRAELFITKVTRTLGIFQSYGRVGDGYRRQRSGEKTGRRMPSSWSDQDVSR